jgi:hypothetical protein
MNQTQQRPAAGPGAGNFTVECRSFRRVEKNTLKGFVSIKITPPGLVVNDICLHEKQGRRWLSFPAKPYQDKDGKQQRWPIVEIEDREVLRHFQAAGLEAIDRFLGREGGAA